MSQPIPNRQYSDHSIAQENISNTVSLPLNAKPFIESINKIAHSHLSNSIGETKSAPIPIPISAAKRLQRKKEEMDYKDYLIKAAVAAKKFPKEFVGALDPDEVLGLLYKDARLLNKVLSHQSDCCLVGRKVSREDVMQYLENEER